MDEAEEAVEVAPAPVAAPRVKRRSSRASGDGVERRADERARPAHPKRSKAADGAPVAASDAPLRRASQDRRLMPPPPPRPPARTRPAPEPAPEPAPAAEAACAEAPDAPPDAPPEAPPAAALPPPSVLPPPPLLPPPPPPVAAVPFTSAVAADGVPAGSLFALRWRAPAPTVASLRASLAEHCLPEVMMMMLRAHLHPLLSFSASSHICVRCCPPGAGCELPGVLLRAGGHAHGLPRAAAARGGLLRHALRVRAAAALAQPARLAAHAARSIVAGRAHGCVLCAVLAAAASPNGWRADELCVQDVWQPRRGARGACSC
jgi:hypothetical protein